MSWTELLRQKAAELAQQAEDPPESAPPCIRTPADSLLTDLSGEERDLEWDQLQPICVPAWSEPRYPHLWHHSQAETLEFIRRWNQEALERWQKKHGVSP